MAANWNVSTIRAAAPYFGYEFALAPDVIELGLKVRPDLAMLVPERREEITTESGLDVVARLDEVTETVGRFQEVGIPVSLFTAIFSLARTVGWIAQLNEMIGDPEYKIGRPRQLFTGSTRRDVKPITER